MHVALIGAEFEENLAVRYLRGALEARGHSVSQLVFNDRDDLEPVAHALLQCKAELAGLSMVFTYRAREFADLARRIRALGYQGHLIAGGSFASFHPEQLLKDVPALDSVGCGEGESILCDLAEHLSELEKVQGLVWRKDGALIRNAPSEKPLDLDSLPIPPRKVPFDSYLGIPITNLLSSRGCTHACAFCSIAAWHKLCGGPRFRQRSPKALAGEMAALYHQGARIFNFHDDNFLLGSSSQTTQRLESLRAELGALGVGPFAFAIKARPDSVEPELFAYLKRMGLFRVFLGIEAGSPQALRQLGRGQSASQNTGALRILNELDIHCCFNLLLLNPDSTLADLAENVAFLRSHPQNPMNFCRTEVYSGTPLEHRLRAQGRLLGDYWGYDYRIEDPLAQAAFEAMTVAFQSRNYGAQALHHQTMAVDYEYQLLSHFFGSRPALRQKVKSFIAQVNLNTCEHLECLTRHLAQHSLPLAPSFIEALTERVESDNARLGFVACALSQEIRQAAKEPSRKRTKWMRAAAAASLAATITLGAGACRKERSHPTECVAPPPSDVHSPPPPESIGTAPFEQAPRPPDSGSAPSPLPELGDPAILRPAFIQLALSAVASRIVPSQETELELWIDDKGQVRQAMIRRAVLTDKVQAALQRRLLRLQFTDPQVRSKRFILVFSAAELDAARAPTPRDTHRTEMAPQPAQHYSEEIAPRNSR